MFKEKKIRETLQKVLFHNGPVIAHFKVEAEHCLPFVKPGDSLENVLLDDMFELKGTTITREHVKKIQSSLERNT